MAKTARGCCNGTTLHDIVKPFEWVILAMDPLLPRIADSVLNDDYTQHGKD